MFLLVLAEHVSSSTPANGDGGFARERRWRNLLIYSNRVLWTRQSCNVIYCVEIVVEAVEGPQTGTMSRLADFTDSLNHIVACRTEPWR